MANACGVDFGTSNSTVGWSRPGWPVLLPLEDGKPTLPSAVFFNADENEVRFGRAALADYLGGDEGRLMRSMKSLLGTSLIDGQTEVLGHALPFRMLLSRFIAELKRRAESAGGCQFDCAVFGRPVHFVDADPKADRMAEDTLREIASAAGYRNIAFQYEPIAAAFDYESRIEREELVLVADIGGGTSDFSLIRLGPQRTARPERRDDILANGGIHIGGTDFDKYLSLSSVMPMLGMGSLLRNGREIPSTHYFNLATWHTINLLYTRKTERELNDLARDSAERDKVDRLLDLIRQRSGHWLALQVEAGKISLSDHGHVELALDRLSPPQTLSLDRTRFEIAVEHLALTVADTVAEVLRSAGVAAHSVDTLFFTGGASGVPLLRSKIAAAVPGARVVEGDLFGSIGAGLALDAHRKFG